ncbi:MAG: hypothetical protein IIB41_03300 [Candidatus Marinimicrobia bacterium]|nr:hypothetical protein [Candidatus Neomarinimicrobiota bacterium]
MGKSKEEKKLYSSESEKGLLGAILLNESELENVTNIVANEDFYHIANQNIFNAMLELYAPGRDIDTITVSEQLASKGLLESVGGSYYITGLPDECPAPSRAVEYARIVRKHSINREKKKLAKQIAKNPDDDSLTIAFEKLSAKNETIPTFSESDAGNAEMLAYHYGDKIRYNHSEGKWFIWNGNYWEQDVSKKVYEYAKETAKQRQLDALNITDSTKKILSLKFALKFEDHHKINACLNSAKSHRLLATTANDWNVDPFRLQCKNGVLVLDNEIKFIASSPEMMTSQSIGCEYVPEAGCPTFEKALSEMMNNRQQLFEFVQRAIGYSLSGEISEHCFFIMYGSGANGKTVLQNTIKTLLGDYAKHSQFAAFTQRYNNSQTNDLARLHSARIVIASEGSDSKKFDEEQLKQITGADNVTARFLYHESFTFTPKFKLWLAVNSLPKVDDVSEGFWRRVRIIPFERLFEGEDRDPNLEEKLKKELPGILNWALRGFQTWKQQGLTPPSEVLNATKEYQTESDDVAQFLEDQTLRDDNSRIRTNDLYSAFCNWHEREYSGKPMTQNRFSRRVGNCISRKPEKIGSYKWFVGIQLKESPVDH